MMNPTRTVLIVLGITAASFAGTQVEAIPLTNTAVTGAQLCALFDCGGSIGSDEFAFDPGGTTPDGLHKFFAFPGTAPSTTGLYLYGYALENYAASSETFHGFSADWPSLYDSLDLDGDTIADTSWYCSDCGGLLVPAGATYTPLTGSLSFSYPGPIGGVAYPEIQPGDVTTYFGAVAAARPGSAIGTVLNTEHVASPSTVAPVPEPMSMVLLGSGLLGLGALRRRR